MPPVRSKTKRKTLCRDTCEVLARCFERCWDDGMFDGMDKVLMMITLVSAIRKAHLATGENVQAELSNAPKAAKVRHVKSAGQDRGHVCHWPGCGKQCPPARWGCTKCWFKLPKGIRDRIWTTYRIGQERDGRPSLEYVAAARAAQEWIRANHVVED